MSFLFSTSNGFDLREASSIVGFVSYEPVIGEAADLLYMYKALPSFYDELMGNKEVFSNLWSSIGQVLTNDLINLWHTDYSISPNEITTYNQRKWHQFKFYNYLSYENDLDSFGNISFVKQQTSLYRLTSINLGGVNFKGDFLDSYVTDEFSFNMEVEFELDSASSKGGFLVGYINRESKKLRSSLSFGVTYLHNSAASSAVNERKLTICHANPLANVSGVTVSRGSITLSSSNRYKILGSYSHITNVAKADVVYIKKEIATIPILESGDSPFKNSFSLGSTSAVVGDFIKITLNSNNIIAEIKNIDSNNAYLDRDCIPVNFSTNVYLLRDTVEDSISLNLATQTSNKEFSADSFGVFNLDSTPVYKEGSVSYDSLVSGVRQDVNIYSWKYFNPLSSVELKYLPSLQKAINSTTKLIETKDYEVLSNGIAFKVLPDSDLYAEFVAFDEKTIYKNYGVLLGLSEEASSEEYKSRVQGLLYSYYKGPTIQSIRVGTNLLLGLPVVTVPGTVTVHNKNYSGTKNQIVIGGLTYYYPKVAGSSLQVGDSLNLFDSICDAVNIRDYISSPNWISGSSYHELQKYHLFSAKIDLESLISVNLEDVVNFLDNIKPSFKSYSIDLYRTEVDEIDISDDINIELAIEIIDTILDEYDPRYDSEAGGLYSYATGLGFIPGTEITSYIENLSELDTKNAYWSEPKDPDIPFVPHLFEVDPLTTTKKVLQISSDLEEAESNADPIHYFGKEVSSGTSAVLTSDVLLDSAATFSFSGTKRIILVSGEDVYYRTCTLSSSTELDISPTMSDGTYNYKVLEEFDESDIEVCSGNGILNATSSLEDEYVTFTDSSGTFLTDIDTHSDQSPIDSVYVSISGLTRDLVLPVSRVLSNTTLELVCIPSYSADLVDDIGQYITNGTSSYKVINPTTQLILRKSDSLSGTVQEDSPIITVPISSSTFITGEILKGDVIIFRSPYEIRGANFVLSSSYDVNNHYITVDTEFPITGAVDFDIFSYNSTEYDIQVRKTGASPTDYSLNTMTLQAKVTFTPILSVDSTSLSTGYFYLKNSTNKFSIQLWNTNRSFLNFDIYEIESPQDEITITFSDGRPSISA